jgi:hypothetical protein
MLSVYAARVLIPVYLSLPHEVTLHIIKYYINEIKPTKNKVKQIITEYENPIHDDYMVGWTFGLNEVNQRKRHITINTCYIKGPEYTLNCAFRHLDYKYKHHYVYDPLHNDTSCQDYGWLYTLYYMRYYTDQVVRV